MVKTHVIKLLAMMLIAMLILVGCNNVYSVKEENNESTENPVKTEEASTENPIETEKSIEAVESASIFDKFQLLVQGSTPISDVFSFIREHQDKVSAEELSIMLLSLEEQQRNQITSLEDRYYSEDGVQDTLFEMYIKNYTIPTADRVDDPSLRQLLLDTVAAGYKVETAEGVFFPVIDYEHYRVFQSNVTDDMKAYIEIMAVESNQTAVKDASIVIGWEEVIARALAMESFIQEYPTSEKLEEIKQRYNGYKFFTFYGTDNTALFWNDNEPMLEDVKVIYKNAVSKEIHESDFLRILKEFLELLEQNDYKLTEEVKQFQQSVVLE